MSKAKRPLNVRKKKIFSHCKNVRSYSIKCVLVIKMNVREEDKRKTSNTTRGLATAAIGLGIGAALYYFLSKGSPHPDSEGATSSGWTHERVFRERPWTLEECSICFDVMLRDQEIMTLACTHNFHAQCIMPWLQEKQTCPNCRKHAD